MKKENSGIWSPVYGKEAAWEDYTAVHLVHFLWERKDDSNSQRVDLNSTEDISQESGTGNMHLARFRVAMNQLYGYFSPFWRQVSAVVALTVSHCILSEWGADDLPL